MKKIIASLFLSISFSSHLLCAQNLAAVKKMIEAKQYGTAIPQLFTIGYQKKNIKIEQIALARYWLGLSLYNTGYSQLASYPLVSASQLNKGSISQKALALLVRISDKDKDSTILDYAIKKIEISQINNLGKELFYTKLAENHINNQDDKSAEQELNNALAVNPKNYFANYNLGLIYLKRNEPRKAYKYFEKNFQNANNAEKRVLANISIARTLYQAKMWPEAVDFYKDIPKNHELFKNALFEQAWAQFRDLRFRAALSTIENLQTPFYDTYFDPESLLLRIIILLYVCHVDDLESSVAVYEKNFRPISKLLSDWETDKKTQEANLKLISEADTNLKYTQAGLQRKYESKIPFFIMRTALSSPHLKTHLQNFKTIQAEKNKFKKTMLAKNKSFSKFADRVFSNRIKTVQKKMSEGFAKYIEQTKKQMDDYNQQFDLVKYEALNVRKNYFKLTASMTEEQKEKLISVADKRDFYTENGYRYWPFESEYWVDEIGNYQFIGQNRCLNE